MAQLSKEAKAFFIGAKFVKEMDYMALKNDCFHYEKGLWKKVDEQTMSSDIAQFYGAQDGFGFPNTHQINEIIRVMRDKTVEEYRESIVKIINQEQKNEINLKDNILDIETMELRPYKKEDFVFSKLPFNYDKNREMDYPVFRNYLFSMFGHLEDDDFSRVVEFIQEWMGYTLIHGNKHHVALIMVGSGRNGKSTLINIWGQLLGKENFSSVDISGINDGQHLLLTKGKLVNFSGELKHGQQFDTGTVKDAIAEGIVTGKEVYKKPESFSFTAKIIIATNELPYVKSVDVNVRDRIHILPFKKVFTQEEKDVDLGSKLAKEVEQIFAWAIQGLLRFRERGHFVLPKICQKAIDKYLYDQDPVWLWLDESGIIKEGEKAKRADVFQSYRSHCLQSNKKGLSKINFYNTLENMGYQKVRVDGYDYFRDLYINVSNIHR